MVRIEATSKDDRTATKLAQLAAAALSKYVRSLNGGDPFQSSVYKQFQQVSGDLAAAQVNQQSLQTQLNAAIAATSAGSLTAPSAEQIENLRQQLTVATAQALQLKFKSDQLSIQFQNVNRVSGNTTELHLVAPAASQGSDRASNLELALVVALAAGILLGLALVTLRSNGPYLRSLRRRAADARA
jgi:hypothetical protein